MSFGNPHARAELLEAIRTHGNSCTVADLKRITRKGREAVAWLLARLLDDGSVTRAKEGRRYLWRVTGKPLPNSTLNQGGRAGRRYDSTALAEAMRRLPATRHVMLDEADA